MKVEQNKVFNSVRIILENQEEIDVFWGVFNHKDIVDAFGEDMREELIALWRKLPEKSGHSMFYKLVGRLSKGKVAARLTNQPTHQKEIIMSKKTKQVKGPEKIDSGIPTTEALREFLVIIAIAVAKEEVSPASALAALALAQEIRALPCP